MTDDPKHLITPPYGPKPDVAGVAYDQMDDPTPPPTPEETEIEMNPYEPEILDEEEDDGTMPENVDKLRRAVVGHRIVSVEKGVKIPRIIGTRQYGTDYATVITLDDGKQVRLVDTDDCCARTELEAFLLHPEMVDHAILGVGTTGDYTTWHIFADMGDVLELTVDWSCGNPFYYGYGFDITVDENSDA